MWLVSVQQLDNNLAHIITQNVVFKEVWHLVDVGVCLVLVQFVLIDVL
jgi:hypothetical protein